MAGLTDLPNPQDPAGRVVGGIEAMRQVAGLIETAEGEDQLELVRAMRSVNPDEAPILNPADVEAHLERNIPRRFRAASFANFKPKTDSQRTALETVQGWCERVRREKGGMLALVGAQGTGKSHLLYAAARALAPWALGRTGLYLRPWYLLADELRYGRTTGGVYPGRASAEPADVRGELWNSRVVLLDEVRFTSGTAFDDTELAKFACYAWDRDLAVLLTTNVHPLENVLGPAAASRFVTVVIDGPDGRKVAP